MEAGPKSGYTATVTAGLFPIGEDFPTLPAPPSIPLRLAGPLDLAGQRPSDGRPCRQG